MSDLHRNTHYIAGACWFTLSLGQGDLLKRLMLLVVVVVVGVSGG